MGEEVLVIPISFLGGLIIVVVLVVLIAVVAALIFGNGVSKKLFTCLRRICIISVLE